MTKIELKARILIDSYRRDTCFDMLDFPPMALLAIGGMAAGHVTGGMTMGITVAFMTVIIYACLVFWYIGRLTARIEKNEKLLEEMR